MRAYVRTLVLGGAMPVLCAAAAAAQPAPDEGPCAAERATQRGAWRAAASPRRQPPATDGALVRHWPTDTLGVWLVEIVREDGAELSRVTPAELVRVTWGAACDPASEHQARPRAAAPRFDDDDLAGLVRRGARGVVHVWSPHMPLSVDAIAPLSQAARGQQLAVDLVLDPAADPAFAARIARERGLPASALRVADSVELQFRDALVHAPAILVYTGGAIVGPVYPGGHTEDEYAAHFKRVLAAPR